MSLNTAHINGGVLIHSGECILLFSDHTAIEWSGQGDAPFKGTKSGRMYLTTHRLIFNNKHNQDAMLSFSFPFITLSDVEIEQPVFGANYIKGKVRAQPNGNWMGEAKFKITFKHGGAIEFGQAMLKAAHLATRGMMNDAPPPYVPPETQWYAAPPPAYQPAPQGYFGWVPPRDAFPDRPPTDGVFMTGAPPPYPGLNPGYNPQFGGGAPPQGGDYNPGYGGGQGQAGYNPGFNGAPPQGGGGSGGYNPGYGGPSPPQSAYNPGFGGAPPPPQSGGYNHQFGGQGGYNPGFGAPPGYPQGGAAGFAANGGDAKAAEAAQSAYYDPSRPQMAFVPPPAYYENPPSYNQATNKKQQ